jgi:hypothetical protein
MRRLVLLALMVLVAGCGGDDPGPRTPGATVRDGPADATWPTPERYQLELGYDARRFRLAGLQRIAFRNTGPDRLAAVWLRTWGNAFGSCERRFVRVLVRAGGRAGEERAGCTALEVRLERPLAPGERGAIELGVLITAPRRPDRFGRYAGAAYFGNAVPVLAVADARGWSLPPYTFRGESFYSLSAAWDVRIALPRGVRAATTGRSGAAPPRVAAARAGRARDFMIVAGPLRETRIRAGDVVVRHWRLRDRPAAARRAAARAATVVRTYGGWFGPYARSELDVVEGPATVARGSGIGMEYPELVLSPPTPFVLDHEVAHQWFYGIVGNDQQVAPWLDESFASYAANRLEGVAPRCPAPRAEPPSLTATMAAFARASQQVYGDVIYRAGPCALREIERAFGGGRFLGVLRRIVREHRDGVLTTAGFVAALRESAPPGVNVDALLRAQRIVA